MVKSETFYERLVLSSLDCNFNFVPQKWRLTLQFVFLHPIELHFNVVGVVMNHIPINNL